MRRGPLNPFFSKRAVAELAGLIQTRVDKLCARLEEFQKSENPVDLRLAFSALTVDVISMYAYGKSFNILEKPDMDPNLYKNIASAGELALLLKQYPWIFKMASVLPYWLLTWLNPNVIHMVNQRKVMQSSYAALYKSAKLRQPSLTTTSARHVPTQ